MGHEPWTRGTRAEAGFEGELALVPVDCEVQGSCRLAEKFGFVDRNGLGWEAAKGLQTDGASIPLWARPLVGGAFEDAFIKAAVIHDHYCDRRVRTWRRTHRVFYEALLASGVSKSKSGVMYFAVLVGGPKWVKLVKGRYCSTGSNCVNFDPASHIGNSLSLSEDGDVLLARRPVYDTDRFRMMLSRYQSKLEAKGEQLTAEDVDQLALEEMKGDFFFEAGDEVGVGPLFKPDFVFK